MLARAWALPKGIIEWWRRADAKHLLIGLLIQSAASLDVGGMVIIAIQATRRQLPPIKTPGCVKTPQPTKPRHPFRGTKLVTQKKDIDDQEEVGCTYLDAAGLELGARRWTSQGMRGHSIRASTAQISEAARACMATLEPRC